MLQSLLADRMKNEQLSARDAARQIGVSHTTIIRLLKGDIPNIENLVAVSQWLGVSVAAALGVESGTEDNIAAKLAMIMEAEPRLGELFQMITEDFQAGKLTAQDVDDILAYAAFRLHRKDNTNEQMLDGSLLEGD